MTSHAHGPGDSVSTAKLTLYGSIGTALIGAAALIIVAMMNHNNVSTVAKESPPTTIASTPTVFTPTLSQESDDGSFNKVQINGTGGVTVSGVAEKYVNVAFVVIGPKPSGGYWYGQANVLNQHWQADVATDPPWQNYSIWASYWPSGGAPPGEPLVPNATSEAAVPAVAPAGRLVSETTSQSALKFTFQPEATPPPPPPPVPDELVNCAVQFGPSCFTGPGFGPPSVYHPKQ